MSGSLIHPNGSGPQPLKQEMVELSAGGTRQGGQLSDNDHGRRDPECASDLMPGRFEGGRLVRGENDDRRPARDGDRGDLVGRDRQSPAFRPPVRASGRRGRWRSPTSHSAPCSGSAPRPAPDGKPHCHLAAGQGVPTEPILSSRREAARQVMRDVASACPYIQWNAPPVSSAQARASRSRRCGSRAPACVITRTDGGSRWAFSARVTWCISGVPPMVVVAVRCTSFQEVAAQRAQIGNYDRRSGGEMAGQDRKPVGVAQGYAGHGALRSGQPQSLTDAGRIRHDIVRTDSYQPRRPGRAENAILGQ